MTLQSALGVLDIFTCWGYVAFSMNAFDPLHCVKNAHSYFDRNLHTRRIDCVFESRWTFCKTSWHTNALTDMRACTQPRTHLGHMCSSPNNACMRVHFLSLDPAPLEALLPQDNAVFHCVYVSVEGPGNPQLHSLITPNSSRAKRSFDSVICLSARLVFPEQSSAVSKLLMNKHTIWKKILTST